MTYKVILAVAGVDILSAEFNDVIRQFPDVGWQDIAGSTAASVYSTGDIASEACTFSRKLEHAGLGKVTGVVDEFVNVSEIAARLNSSRETVRSWASGTRGPGGFPSPHHVHGDASGKGPMKVWRWADVNTWLANVGMEDGYTYPTHAQTIEIESHLLRLPEPAGQEWQRISTVSLAEPDHLHRRVWELLSLFVGSANDVATPARIFVCTVDPKSKRSRYADVKSLTSPVSQYH